MLLNLIVLDSLALLALQPLLELEIESVCRVLTGFLLFFIDEEFLKQMREVLSRVLLLSSAKLLVTLANKCLEDSWSYTILVELIFLFLVSFDFFSFDDYFLSNFFG